MADIDPTLVQQIFNIPKRKWESDIHHHRQADDFRTCLEVLEWIAFCHPATLVALPARLKQVSYDTAASSMRLRFLNEVPTVILIAVVFLIVLRDAVGWVWGVGGILGLAVLLTLAIKRYQKARGRRKTGDGA